MATILSQPKARALVTALGTTKQISDGEKLLVGDGIDASNEGAPSTLSIGTDAAQTSAITVGQASPFVVQFPGDVQIQGNVNTVGGTTFTDDVTFQGNTTFGNGPSDTVTFAETTTVINDIAFGGSGYRVTNMLDPLAAQDGATKAYADLKLALAGGTMSGAINMGSQKITSLANGTASTDAINLSQLNAVAAIEYDQQIFVAAGADPLVATGAPLRPFASVSAAMAAITDASPTKRYAISVSAGTYTEASALNLKPNVFIIGTMKDSVRITAPSFGLDASFTGAADNRTGAAQAVLTGAANFDFGAVTSSAGKLYFQSVAFNSAVSLLGFAAINQAQFDSCLFYGALNNVGVNIGVHTNNIHFSNIVLGQSAVAGVPTFLVATGGSCGGTVTATTTVNDFNKRISVFARSFLMNGAVTVDGPSSYLDYTVDSLPSGGASTPNGGNLVSIDYGANKALSNLVYPTAVNNPIIPASTNATNMGDWSKQWFFSFSYVYLSTGTDLYIGSAGTSAVPDSAGRTVYLQPDQYGVDVNVNGGVLDLRSANTTGTGTSGNVDVATGTTVNGNSGSITLTTGTPSGTGTRGVISLNGRQIDANSVKIVNLANGTNPNDAVNFSQLSAIVSGVSNVTATAPLSSTEGPTPDISLTGIIDVANGGTGAATLTGYLSGNGASAFTASATIPGADVSGDISGNAANVTGTVAVANGGTGVTSLGTGSVDALQVNVGSAGSFVVNGGALGTPSSGTLTNATGLPLSTGVTGTLPVANGGTGAVTLTGYLSGNGTSAVTASASIPGADVSGDISGNAANVNGTVAVANGGTGQVSLTSGALVVGNGASAVNPLSPGSNGDVLTVVAGVWTSQAVPAATDYSVVSLTTAQAANTAVTVAGVAAQATSASAARVAGIVAATDSVKVLGIVTCLVQTNRAGQISAGEAVYLSASEAGKVTDVAPSTPTQVIAEMGIATAADGSGTVTVLWQPKAIVVL